jgi:hypothetical protein
MPMPKNFEIPVVGVTFQPSYPLSIKRLSENDPVNIVRDRTNEADPNAIRVEDTDGVVLGFIPSAIAQRLAPELDSGVVFAATIRPLVNQEYTNRPGAMLHVTKKI